MISNQSACTTLILPYFTPSLDPTYPTHAKTLTYPAPPTAPPSLNDTPLLPAYSPVKADFIRSKHQMLSFVIQPPSSSSGGVGGGSSVPRPHSPAPLTATIAAATAGGGGGGGEEERVGGDGGDQGAGVSAAEEEASKELHSSVRTGNLETSLRLLSQGADPNYYHKVTRRGEEGLLCSNAGVGWGLVAIE